MFKDESQYDTDGNIELCVLADYIYKNKIISKDELDIKALKALLSNRFFIDYNSSINSCKRKGSEIKLSDIKGTSSKLLSCYTNGIDKYAESDFIFDKLGIRRDLRSAKNIRLFYNMMYEILCIVDEKTSKTKKIKFKASAIPLDRFIEALYTVGERRANNPNNDKAACKITNNKIDISNYVILCSINITAGIKNRKELLLALDKLNCNIYLIIGYDNKYFYTLFRFKNIVSGYNLMSCKCGVTSCDLEKLADDNFINKNSTKNSELQEVRDAIMNGYPNNYPYIGNYLEMFKSLAKQPK